MKHTGLIFCRETKSYFSTPVAYVVIALFLIMAGITFSLYLTGFVEYCERYVKNAIEDTEDPSAVTPNINELLFGGVLGNMSLFLLFVLPFMTMRLFAEEKRTGTAELLLTYPLTDSEIILGKFSACVFLLAIMLL
ncbi:MAG TPA: ABC transporter permease subunit, partial [bacterium]|nr:ABC transporter permease subunit [bacterium]